MLRKMKTEKLRGMSTEKLEKLKRDLSLDLVKSKCVWRKKEESNLEVQAKKLAAKTGTNTMLIKDIRRTIAKINTILKERK